MTSPFASEAAPFGRVLTAMVTPFTREGELDLDAAQRVATHLVDHGNDGLVVSGTTGESPTTTVAEDGQLLAAVLDAVGDRATVVAGVGTNDTRHSIELAQQAKKIGAHGLLVVTPYYSKPPQSGLLAHFTEVARAGDDTPVMLYDIPGRSGITIANDTYRAMADNPLIIAMKDAVGDLDRGTWLIHELGFTIYSGDDPLNLAWLAIGASGVVSVVGHAAGRQYSEMVAAVDAGDL
ncbi:MAG: 4-hydroxy-tetrahydrodipicolinate synthase, partial [Aeromicrobium sp.]